MSITACHNCQLNGKGDPRCIECRRISQDDIRIKKSPHLGDRTNEILSNNRGAFFAATSTDKFSTDEMAERVRMLLYTVSELTPLEFVAALHFARGGRLSDLSAELRRMVKSCAGSRLLKDGRRGRVLVGMKKKTMVERYAPFSAVLGSSKKRA